MINNPDRPAAVLENLCPCGKGSRGDLERISRGLLVKSLLFWLPLKRYKCVRCRRKRLVLG
jgi:hypothetical protein